MGIEDPRVVTITNSILVATKFLRMLLPSAVECSGDQQLNPQWPDVSKPAANGEVLSGTWGPVADVYPLPYTKQ